ncbi:MAG: Fe-S cluster assembly protein SufD, partial [Acidimicrobiales bacterium]
HALPPAAQHLSQAVEPARLAMTVNGHVTGISVPGAEAASGIRVTRASSDQGAALLMDRLDGLFTRAAGKDHRDSPPAETGDVFGLLAQAFSPDAVVVHVSKGAVVPDPILVVHTTEPVGTSKGGSSPAVFPRTVVVLEENAEATVIELLVSDDTRVLMVPTVELVVGDSARLSHLLVQQLGAMSWQVARLFASAGRDATLRSFQASLGAYYARSRIDSVLTGQGGSAQLLAVYFGSGDQMHDFRTLQEHEGSRTTSDLVFKGAVADRSRSVYSGTIRMRRGARGANAFQTNRNLVLSEGAHADSVPNLDIEENDVKCSHASAVGPIDEEQRFYLESRGVPRPAAERLILLGFFDELLDRVHPAVSRHVAGEIARRLAGLTTESGSAS